MWTGAGVALFFHISKFGHLGGLPALPWMIGGFVLAFAGLWGLKGGSKFWPRAIAVPIIVGVVLIWGTPFSRWADEFLLQAELERQRPAFEEVIAYELANPQHLEQGSLQSHPDFAWYLVETGPPFMMGFPYDGHPDNHLRALIVYDPTDYLTEHETPLSLFDGKLYSCKPARDHYYRCWYD